MHESFVKPHLDYGDVLYDQPNNESLCGKKNGGIKYNNAMLLSLLHLPLKV